MASASTRIVEHLPACWLSVHTGVHSALVHMLFQVYCTAICDDMLMYMLTLVELAPESGAGGMQVEQMQQANQELRALLNQYLASPVNKELQIPPTQVL